MPWNNYDNMFGDPTADTPKSQGDMVSIVEHEENAQGVQDEFEDRTAALAPDVSGVVSGLAVSASGTSITIGAGEGYANGLEFVGGVVLTATGASGTYHVHIDPGEVDEEDAYKFKVAECDDDEVLLAEVGWNGSAITSCTDCRQWGIDPSQFTMNTDITAALSTYEGAVVREFIAPRDLTIRRPHVRINTCGSGGGPSTFDILSGPNGTLNSIYSTVSLRPSIAHADDDGTIDRGSNPDTAYRLVSAGDLIQLAATGVATGALGLSVTIPVSFR